MDKTVRSAMLARLKASGGCDRVLALSLALDVPKATASRIAELTGVSPAHLQATQLGLDRTLTSDYSQGWCAVRTSALDHQRERILELYRGNVGFWHGAARGTYCASLAASARTA